MPRYLFHDGTFRSNRHSIGLQKRVTAHDYHTITDVFLFLFEKLAYLYKDTFYFLLK